MREMRWIACISACVAGLGLVLSGCGGSSQATDQDGRQAATRFLEDLKAGRIVPAWQETTAEFKSLMGLESLRDYVKTHPALRGEAEYVEARDASREGPSMVEHVFRVEAKVRGKAVTTTARVLVTAANDGSWEVEHLSVE